MFTAARPRIVGVVFVEQGQRRIAQYAKRMVGRRMYGGLRLHSPLASIRTGVVRLSSRRRADLDIPHLITQLDSWRRHGCRGNSWWDTVGTYLSGPEQSGSWHLLAS